MAKDLECASVLSVDLRFLNLRHTLTEADVVVGAARYFEWLRSLKCGDNAWLGSIVTGSSLTLRLSKFATQLEKLVRAPGVELVVLGKYDAVL